MAKITGKILHIYPTQQLTSKSGNAFTKRDFVVAVQSFDRDTGAPTIDDDNTPQLSLTGDRCSQLDGIRRGDIVTIDYFLRGRRYRGEDGVEKIITDINVSSVRPVGGAPIPAQAPVTTASMPVTPYPSSPSAPASAQAAPQQPKDKSGDLPF